MLHATKRGLPFRAYWRLPPWLPALGVLIVPLLIGILWHLRDHSLPSDDHGDIVHTAVLLYRSFAEHGPLQGFEDAYLVRDTARPFLSPLFALPFLALSGGNVDFAIPAALLLFHGLLLTYSYLALRAYGLEPLSAAISASLVGTLPWVLYHSHVFYSEIGMLAGLAAATYHARRSANWTSPAHSAATGLALGVTLGFRLWEVAVPLAIVMAIVAVYQLRARVVIPREVLGSAGLLCIGAAVLFLRAEVTVSTLVGIMLTLVLVVVFAPYTLEEARHRRCLPMAALVFLLVVALWWMPYIHHSYNTMRTIMFNEFIAENYPGHYVANPAEAAKFYLDAVGHVQFQFLALIVLMTLTVSTFSRRWDGRGLILIGAGIVFVVVQIAATAYSHTGDPRRIYGGALLLGLGLCTVALSSRVRFSGIRLGLLIAVLAFQLSHAALIATDSSAGLVTRATRLLGYNHRPSAGFSDRAVFREIAPLVPDGSVIAPVAHAIYFFPERVFDRASLNVLAASAGRDVFFGLPSIFATPKEGYAALRDSGYDFVLLDLRYIEAVQDLNPQTVLASAMVRCYEDGSISEAGFNPVKAFTVDDREVVLLTLGAEPTAPCFDASQPVHVAEPATAVSPPVQVADPNTPPCVSVGLTSDPQAPQAVGTAITFTALASGCASPEYRFWHQPPGGDWELARDWESSGTFVWDTTEEPPGAHRVDVHARRQGGGETEAATPMPDFHLTP